MGAPMFPFATFGTPGIFCLPHPEGEPCTRITAAVEINQNCRNAENGTPFNGICNFLQWDVKLPSMGYATPFNGMSNSLQ